MSYLLDKTEEPELKFQTLEVPQKHQDRAVPKFNLYANIHKALRKEIFTICISAGNTDFFDPQEAELFAEKFRNLIILLKTHAEHEETFIHPLLVDKNLVELNSLKEEHKESEEDFVKLEISFAQVIACDTRSTCLEYANNFYLELCQFASHYNEHLFFEEQQVMSCLSIHYQLAELLAMMDRFKKSQTVEETMGNLLLMFTALRPDESSFMLTQMQESMPQELFKKICMLAKNAMSKANWEKIEAHLAYIQD